MVCVVNFAADDSFAAAKLKTLHDFCVKDGCSDGALPNGELLMDAEGNLYGTSAEGTHNAGNVFALILDPATGKRKYRVLHNFCAEELCADGSAPNGSLIADTKGNLYGTTRGGGNSEAGGTAFELMPNADRSKWKLKTLYKFCSLDTCADGEIPWSGLTYTGASSGAPYDGHSPVYGATYGGGLPLDAGIVFQLTRTGKTWSATSIHDFCSGDCDDGINPVAVMADGNGNLFGAAAAGGPLNQGTVFELSPDNGNWMLTSLYGFCQQAQCVDGAGPAADLVMDESGSLYGTTSGGGASGEGMVFKIVPNGVNSQLTVLYNFCTLADCADGAKPLGKLTVGANGDLFGTTLQGGVHSQFGGTVFRLRNGSIKLLHSFCALADCADGTHIHAGVIMDESANLLGVASSGGTHGGGTVFELRPGR